jgi:type I restriction enzyme S subunit
MGGEAIWPTRPLKDCAVWYSGGTPNKATPRYWGGSIPWISARSLNDFFVSDSEDRVTEEGARNGTRLVPKDSILFIVRGMSLKSEFRLGIATRPVTFNQDLKALVAVDDVVPAYLAYAIRSKTTEILQMVGEAGHGTGVLPTDRIQSLEIPVPSLEEQHAVAAIVGALDAKIELNRKMNATLEAMARALFKSWFVDGPEADWKTAPLAEWVDVLSGGTPSKSNAAFWGGPLKWISPKAMTSIHSDECDDNVSEQAVGNGTRIAPKGSTLVMVRGMGLHDGVRVSQAREDVTFNQDVKALVPRSIEADLLLFAMLDAQEELHKRVETSGHGTGKMPSELLLAHPITMPSRVVQRDRAVHISALNDRIGANRSESRSLARVRDELLPRLVSGELAIAEAEHDVGAVA